MTSKKPHKKKAAEEPLPETEESAELDDGWVARAGQSPSVLLTVLQIVLVFAFVYLVIESVRYLVGTK